MPQRPIDLRKVIQERRKALGIGVYDFGRRVVKTGAIINAESVARFLRGERDCSGQSAAAMIGVLGGRVVFDPDPPPKQTPGS